MCPVYEYECEECGEVMEVMQYLKDPKLKEYDCPKCNASKPVKKIITSMNFKLIGRCWASDGYTDGSKEMTSLI